MRRIERTLWLLALTGLLLGWSAACTESGDDDSDDDDDADDDIDDDDDDSDDDDDLPAECDEIYSQDLLPTFEIEISTAEWEALVYQYQHGMELPDPETYHPLLAFRYNDELIENAAIRLRGSADHWWPDPKMQFNISFKEYDPEGRFHGLRKLNLDNAHTDYSYLRDRLAMQFFRDLGVPAPCVNHARLNVNGGYFGLYVNIEHVDQEFLQRNFGDEDQGNLYKCQPDLVYDKKTNEDDPDRSDLERFESDLPLDELLAMMDEEEALTEWAGEALVPHWDGYFTGAVNFYLYNHPSRGFMFIPWDIDYSFDAAGWMQDLISFRASWGRGKPPQFTTVLADPVWRERYIDQVEAELEFFDQDLLLARIEAYDEQIAQALIDDPNLSFALPEHAAAVGLLRQHIQDRVAFVPDWLTCLRNDIDFQTVDIAGTRYHLIETACSRQRALENCVDLGGTLATPYNSTEQNALSAALLELLWSDWWIGASDLDQEGVWIDAAGNPLSYTAWGPGEPLADEWADCAQITRSYNGLWSADYCIMPEPAVCIADTTAERYDRLH